MFEQPTAANPALHVVFAGLCMLVRDETEKEKELHVLLPSDHKHAGHSGGPEKHSACLIYGAAYGGTGTTTGQMRKVDLNGLVLDVRAVGGEKPPRLKVEGVVDERCMGGDPVKREYISAGTPTHPVKSRISLASGREGRKHGGVDWKLGKCKEPMAIWLEWVIRPKLVGGKVELAIHREGSMSTLELTPPADGHIYLFILHVPENQVPDALPDFPFEGPAGPLPTSEAKHFRAFYPLIGRSENDTGPVPPEDRSGSSGDTQTGESSGSKKLNLGFDYGCMMATALAAG